MNIINKPNLIALQNKWEAESFFDMFGFSEEEPSFENYDVSSCFKKKMENVYLWIEGEYIYIYIIYIVSKFMFLLLL